MLYTEYSRNDIPKKAVRSIVNTTLSNTLAELNISQTTVAYSRPKNIKDLLSKAKLHQAKGKEVSIYYTGGQPNNWAAPLFFQNHTLASPAFGLRLLAPDFGKKKNLTFLRGSEKNRSKICFIFEIFGTKILQFF